MDIVVWILAGAALGWAAFSYMGLSEGRGKMISVIIGAAGGVIGGKLIAPMFTSVEAVPDSFSGTSVLFAAVVATIFLVVGNLVYNRWDV
jgi:uncharacterized membrane protein YeaQ/YmgE (transglycosylase-associated protein family)